MEPRSEDLRSLMVNIEGNVRDGRYDEARHILASISDHELRCGIFYGWMAQMYERMGDTTSAIAAVGLGIALEPKNYFCYRILSKLLLQQGNVGISKDIREIGWSHKCKAVPRSEIEHVKEDYFC